jgi:hypothetical protein
MLTYAVTYAARVHTYTRAHWQQGALSLAKVLEMEPKNAEAKASLQIAQVSGYTRTKPLPYTN